MRIREIVLGLAVGVVLFTGGPAAADRRELDLFAGTRGEYNDNIFFESYDSVDDFITTLSGGLKFLNQTERTDLQLSAILERLIYAEEGYLDATDQYYKGRLGHRFTPRFGAKIDAAYTRDSRPDRDVAATGLILSTVPRKVQNYGIEADYALTDITATNLHYRYTQQDFEPRSFERSLDDYRAHRTGLGFAHRLDRYFLNATGRLNFGYNRFTYPETGTETRVAILTVGLAHELSEKWRLLLDIGPDYYDTEFRVFGFDFSDSGWGGTGRFELAYQAEYTGTRLTLSHGIEPASGREGSAQRTAGIFDVFYRFAERGRAGFAAGYYVNKANAGELALLPLDERTVNFRPWLRFDIIFDRLYLEASYTYSRVDDRIRDRDRDRNLVWLQLGLDWPILK